jgi:hypothetical protein
MKVVFEQIRSFEFEISSDNGNIVGKIELFQNLENSEHFRFRTLEAEMFRLIPTFPTNEDGQPLHISDEMFWVMREFPSERKGKNEFVAKDIDEAIKIVLAQIELYYKHILP